MSRPGSDLNTIVLKGESMLWNGPLVLAMLVVLLFLLWLGLVILSLYVELHQDERQR
jgi:hypothetical protein